MGDQKLKLVKGGLKLVKERGGDATKVVVPKAMKGREEPGSDGDGIPRLLRQGARRAFAGGDSGSGEN